MTQNTTLSISERGLVPALVENGPHEDNRRGGIRRIVLRNIRPIQGIRNFGHGIARRMWSVRNRLRVNMRRPVHVENTANERITNVLATNNLNVDRFCELLETGIDPNFVDHSGKSIVEIAEERFSGKSLKKILGAYCSNSHQRQNLLNESLARRLPEVLIRLIKAYR